MQFTEWNFMVHSSNQIYNNVAFGHQILTTIHVKSSFISSASPQEVRGSERDDALVENMHHSEAIANLSSDKFQTGKVLNCTFC
jgi:hypothetical protein